MLDTREVMQAVIENASAFIGAMENGDTEAQQRLDAAEHALIAVAGPEWAKILVEVDELLVDQMMLALSIFDDSDLAIRILRSGFDRCQWGLPDEDCPVTREDIENEVIDRYFPQQVANGRARHPDRLHQALLLRGLDMPVQEVGRSGDAE